MSNKKKTKHLWHHMGFYHVRSECDLLPQQITSVDLSTNPADVNCVACLIAKREHNTREAAECTDQIAKLIDGA